MGHEAVGTIEAVDPTEAAGLEAAGFGRGTTVTFNPLVGCGTCTACAQERPQHYGEKHVIGSDARYHGALAEFGDVPAGQVLVAA